MPLDSVAHAEVGDRQYVEPAEREDQEHLGGPDADAIYGREHVDDLVIGFARQTLEVEPAIVDMRGEVLDKRYFRAGHARGAKHSVGGIEILARRWKSVIGGTGFDKAIDDGSGGFGRELLRNDRANKDFVVPAVRAEPTGSVAANEFAHERVAPRKVALSRLQCMFERRIAMVRGHVRAMVPATRARIHARLRYNPRRREDRALTWIDALLLIAAIGTGVIAAYLLLLTIGSFLLRKRTADGGKPLRIAVVCPAHNEELQIASTVEQILASDFPRDCFDVYVIADNCSDATAARAREAGATAFERHDLSLRGKGQAIDWLLKTQRPLLEHYDAIALVDADTLVDRRFLREVSESLSHPEVQVVQGWHGVSNPEANWRTALTYAAFALVNGLRPAGRSFWGGTSDLKGNGMAFRARLLLEYGWPAHSIVEDIEFSNRLLLDGVLVRYNPDAIVISEMPTGTKQAEPQRRRWERGRMQTIRDYAPMLLWTFLRSPRWRYLDALLELCTPPLSLLVFGQTVLVIVALLVDWRWAMVFGAYLLVTVLYVISGLVQRRAPRSVWLGLLAVPLFLLWKIPFYLRLFFGKKQEGWERTRRAAEIERSGEPKR